MKALLTLLCILSIPAFCMSQDNWKPADSSTSWTGRSITYTGPGWADNYFMEIYSQSENFDTTIAETIYTKLYSNTQGYWTAYRSDTLEKALYVLPKDSTEELLYFDFDATYTIGDTVSIPTCGASFYFYNADYQLITIDSALIDGAYYTYWEFYFIPESSEEAVAEYLQIMERFITYQQFPFIGPHFETELELKCYQENDTSIMGSWCPFSQEDLDATSGVKGTTDTELVLYPNPVIDKIHLTNPTSEIGKFNLYSMQGELILSETIQAGKNTIPFTKQETGVYFYVIQYGSKRQDGRLVLQ